MLDFKPITIDDKEIIQGFFDKNVFGNCDFSFANIFSWKHLYNTTFAVEDGFLYIRFQARDDLPGYLFPLGAGDLKKALECLSQDAKERIAPVHLYAVTQKMFDFIEEIMPGQFSYEKERDWYEYIYSSEDLISLVGKKYQAKRNHINKFKRTYQWEYLPITREIIPDCLKLYERWCAENGGCNTEQTLVEERIATEKAFHYFEKLGLIGGALRITGEILAYSYGQSLGKDVFGVHAEKCLYEIDGGFTMINQQFAEHNCAAYPYINREEDLGLESLRKAKMSYQPAILLEKGSAWMK
ncbi:hypothetical protein FACS189432_08110 [Bacteroidia bacterium]|nr:hypothetical protein FACS189432_08110 [Bacteroidia bacterium]